MYLISRNQVHSIPASRLSKAKVMVFAEEFFHHIEEVHLRQLFQPFENKGIEVPEDGVQALDYLFSLLLLECAGEADVNLLLNYVTAFLHHLYRFEKHRLPIVGGDDVRMVKLFQLVEENFKENRAASFYADQIDTKEDQ